MRYLGGKARLGAKFLPIVLEGRKPDQYFVEPFCGGCNITAMVEGKRIANDLNGYIISMYKAIQKGWEPPDYIDFKTYTALQTNPKAFDPALVGFAGIACSFAGKFLGTYARDDKGTAFRKDARNQQSRNYAFETKKSVLALKGLIKNVSFYSLPYYTLKIPPGSIVYCDPPYAGTSDYGSGFDSLQFWSWVRQVSRYNKVFVSEYVAPKDFKVVWEFERKESVGNNKKTIEKLFTL